MTREDLHRILVEEIEPAMDALVLATPGIKDDIAWAIIKRTVLSPAVLDRVLGKLEEKPCPPTVNPKN